MASCVALSPESGARSSRTVPTRLGYLPPGVSTSSAQQREAGAVVEAPSHRQHRARLLSFPLPRPSTLPRASLDDSSRSTREIAEHEAPGPPRGPFDRPVTISTRAESREQQPRNEPTDQTDQTSPMLPATSRQPLSLTDSSDGGGCNSSSNNNDRTRSRES